MKKLIISLLPTMILAVCTVFGQNVSIKGRVIDNTGQEVIGATVQLKGTSVGVTSGKNGVYSITVGPNYKGKSLIFSFIGMQTKEVVLTEKTIVDVVMDSEDLNIDEVVVIGYGAVRKKELTGAVAQVKSEEIMKLNTFDLGDALQGMVSGVSVTADSGAPGASSSILIRGVTSIDGSNTPLYVVDGVPQEGDPRISPNEIETIDILKDAASAAIYGTRGAAGVILITTKKGKRGATRVAINSNFGIQNITSRDYLMNATEQIYFNLNYKRTMGGATTTDDKTIIDLYKNTGYFHNDTNLLDQVFLNNARVQNHNVNLSGGTEHVSYSIMAGFFEKGGMIINSDFKRFNSRANINFNKGKWKINTSLGLSFEDTEYSPQGIILQSIKYYPNQYPLTSGDSFETVGGEEQNRISHVLESFSMKDNQHMTNPFANFEVRYELIKGLEVSGRMALTRSNGYRKTFKPYKKVINQDGEEISKPENSYVQMISNNRKSMIWDANLQYKKSFGDHNFTLFAGVTGEEYNFESFIAKKEGVLDNSLEVLNGASLNPSATSGANYTNKLIGTIGRLQYDWKGRYLLNASIRRDGSSKFEKNNRWGVFPSASAAWNISDEPFMAQIRRVVSNLKLRVSYGTTGNQNFSPYSYSASITSGYDYVFGTGSNQQLGLGSTQDTYANSLVKWETSKQYNVGLDVALYKNKFTFSAEYYNTDKKDMLFPIVIPGSSGSSNTVILNVGNMTNAGVELAAQYTSSLGKLRYKLNATFSTNKNEITRINGDGTRLSAYKQGLVSGAADYSQVTFFAEGYEAGAFFLYTTDGIINTDEKLAAYQKINPAAQMGDLIYKDTDNDGQITDADRVYCGSGLPKYEVGFNMQLNYRNFDLYLNAFAAMGQKVINGSKATAFGYGRHKDLVAAYSPYNTDSPIPTYRGDLKGHENFRADTDLWLEDGSYLRLKTLTLGYSIPSQMLKKIGISRLRFYVSAQNFLTLTKYSGYDPEIGGGINRRGMDMGNYPSSATYSVGLNLNF